MPARFEHPEWRRDARGRQRQLWLAPEVQEVVDQLAALDDRLALYLEEDPGGRSRWVLERFGEDGQYHVVTRSRPGADLKALPYLLAQRDTWRRGYDPVAEMIAHNEARRAELEHEHNEKLVAALEKVAHGWDKDTHGGVHEGTALPRIRAWAQRGLARSS